MQQAQRLSRKTRLACPFATRDVGQSLEVPKPFSGCGKYGACETRHKECYACEKTMHKVALAERQRLALKTLTPYYHTNAD